MPKISLLPPKTAPLVAGDDFVIVDSADGITKQIPKSDTGLLTPTAVKVGAYTAVTGDLVFYDPSGGTFQIDAPDNATAELGDKFAIKNVTADVTSVTVHGNGQNIEDPGTASLGASFAFTSKFGTVTFIFDSTNWIIV